jgi:tryptophanyl-tRNA synthetase
LFDSLNEQLTPVRERRRYYEDHPETVIEYIHEGSKTAAVLGAETVSKVREAMSLIL